MKAEERINIIGNIVYIVMYLSVLGAFIGGAVKGNVGCLFLAVLLTVFGIGFVVNIKNGNNTQSNGK